VESNSRETAPACAQAALQLGRLLLAHRLDAAAEGVLVFARSRGALSRFTQWQQDGGFVRKEYRALTAALPPLGTLEHYLSPATRGPGLLSRARRKKWKRCELQIRAATPVDPGEALGPEACPLHPAPCTLLPAPCTLHSGPGTTRPEPQQATPLPHQRRQIDRIPAAARARSVAPHDTHCPARRRRRVNAGRARAQAARLAGGRPLYEVEVVLVTGRRHQIRAQLAAVRATSAALEAGREGHGVSD